MKAFSRLLLDPAKDGIVGCALLDVVPAALLPLVDVVDDVVPVVLLCVWACRRANAGELARVDGGLAELLDALKLFLIATGRREDVGGGREDCVGFERDTVDFL